MGQGTRDFGCRALLSDLTEGFLALGFTISNRKEDGAVSGAAPAGSDCSRSAKAIYGGARSDGGAEGCIVGVQLCLDF